MNIKKVAVLLVIVALVVSIPLANKKFGSSNEKLILVTTLTDRVIRPSILASGSLTHEEEVRLSSEVIGKVTKIYVKEGDSVDIDQLVLQVDDQNFVAAFEQSEAQVRLSRIDIERQQTRIVNLELQWGRKKSLFEQEMVGEDEFEALTNQLDLVRIDLKSSIERLRQAEAQLEQASDRLRKTQIKSPISGVVTSLDIKVGETAIASSTNIPGSSLMTIANPSSIYTEVLVDEADVASIALGQSAEIVAIAYTNTPMQGVVRFIANTAKVEQGRQGLSFTVKIKITEANDVVLRPGMSCRAEIFTGALVRYVEKKDNGWIVHYEVAETGQDKFKAPDQFVSADVVILAAGTLGSTELLLRSREYGLKISDRIGKRFSGNGDFLGFSYDCDEEINGIGWGDREPDPNNLVGPCITGIIDTRKNSVNYKEGMSIEEGSIPGALSPILPIMFSAISKFIGVDTDHGFTDYIKEKKRELESLLLGSYRGAVDNTQIYLVMTHDSAEGVMLLKDDRLRIDWPGAGKEEIFKKVQERLLKSTEALGGTFVTNPVWTKIMGHDLMTVHPLGGSVMSDDASTGVVNHKGQVFSSSNGDDVYEGLYVADGSIIPTSLGTNPLLTISAIAERNVSILSKDRGWDFDYDLSSKPASAAPPLKPGIQFTESMKGYFSTRVKDDYEKAANLGKEEGSPFKFILTIISEDLDEMLKNKDHQAKMFGTVEAPSLSAESLTVTEGVFNLFVRDPEDVDAHRMLYRMKLSSEEGKDYYFEGYKKIKDDPGMDMWDDTTTLYITVHDGDDNSAPVKGKGILRILPDDFMKQMTTMKAINVGSLSKRLEYTAKFGRFFAGVLFDTYGGIFAKHHYFEADE
ncbi:MAG: efflux RND transporter periplasmic adaptor subunit [Proteobacteria bacterium]|nr:efflux RND transporter periplasmic adaptor subunit [Pseudomonadota bacterium]